jgi:hypothetical protein
MSLENNNIEETFHTAVSIAEEFRLVWEKCYTLLIISLNYKQ